VGKQYSPCEVTLGLCGRLLTFTSEADGRINTIRMDLDSAERIAREMLALIRIRREQATPAVAPPPP
jgi:hypothetical protein